jgi:hypothetical protein
MQTIRKKKRPLASPFQGNQFEVLKELEENVVFQTVVSRFYTQRIILKP